MSLAKHLVKASIRPHQDVVLSLLKAIDRYIPSESIYLWKLNIAGTLLSKYEGFGYVPIDPCLNESVLSVGEGLIGHMVARTLEKGLSISYIQDKQSGWDFYLAEDGKNRNDLKKYIAVPIRLVSSDLNRGRKTDLVLIFFPKDDSQKISKEDINLIRDHFSVALSLSQQFLKEDLAKRLVSDYRINKTANSSAAMLTILNRTLKRFVPYEGASIFIYNPMTNRLLLLQTTGLVGNPNRNDVTYNLGEGLTGLVAEKRKAIVINGFEMEKDPLQPDYHKEKWIEETGNNVKSIMVLPIVYPSNSHELLGVIRLVNRTNPMTGFIDFFSNKDKDLMDYACKLICPYMEIERNEKENDRFLMQATHEMQAPLISIKGTADRLLRKWDDKLFPETKKKDYLGSIFDHSKLAIFLIQKLEYLWKEKALVPKKNKYFIERVDLRKDIIEISKKMMIPICRDNGLKYENIKIVGDFPVIWTDKFAFQQMFYNMLSNSIKYRLQDQPDKFKINIIGSGLGEYAIPISGGSEKEDGRPTKREIFSKVRGFLIAFEDFGAGISSEDTNNIFKFGFRSEILSKTNIIKGLGIGLPLVRSILADFHSNIWLDNLENPTAFKIFINSELLDNNYYKDVEWR